MSSPLESWINKVRSKLVPKVTVATADATVTADSARYGTVVSNQGASGTITVSLPAAKVGMRVTALVLATQQLRLDPNGTETIALPSGVQQAAGKYIVADAIGESIQLVVIKQGQWEAVASVGTWTAEG